MSVRKVYNQHIKLVKKIEEVGCMTDLFWNFGISIILLLCRLSANERKTRTSFELLSNNAITWWLKKKYEIKNEIKRS